MAQSRSATPAMPRGAMAAVVCAVAGVLVGGLPSTTLDAAGQVAIATALPTEFSSRMFFARATVNGRGPYWFTVDTGATLTVLDPTTAADLQLVVRDAGPRDDVGMGAGETRLATTAGAVIRIGEAPAFQPSPLYVLGVRDAEAYLGHRIDGVLGTDFLRHHVVTFDYARRRVELAPASLATAIGPAGVRVSLEGNRLIVPATLTTPDGTPLAARLLVDTGNSGGLSLNTPFVRAHDLEARFPNVPGDSINLRISVGVNGAVTSRVVSFGRLAIGDAVVDRPDVALSSGDAGLSASPEFDGILGADVLRHFTLRIDYPRTRLALVPPE
ncbi:MAG: pepsin/retropepsin-like aspartic protease family protein [Vicinamibacterales bacterium]